MIPMTAEIPPAALARRANVVNASGTSMARTAARMASVQGRKVVDFTIGELALETHTTVKRAAITAIADGRNGYTDTIGLPALRTAIAHEFSRATDLAWSAEEVAVTAGAKPALLFMSLALLDPGDEVIVPTPYWQTFPAQIRLCGGVPVFVPHRQNGQLDIAAIEAAITPRTRVLLINTPNNPTGAVYGDDSLRAAAELALRHNLWIIFDQCYRSFVYAPKRHRNIVNLDPRIRSRTIIIDSFSKALAIAGWRIGYVVAPPDIIAVVRSLQSHATSCANVIAQHAVLAHLQSQDERFTGIAMQRLTANRAAGLEILSRLTDVPAPIAQGGFYFYLDISRLLGRRFAGRQIATGEDVVTLLLEEAQAATVSGTAFGDPNAIRVSYAVQPGDLTAGLTRLAGVLAALS
jgi:aspartate aminotransferase